MGEDQNIQNIIEGKIEGRVVIKQLRHDGGREGRIKDSPKVYGWDNCVRSHVIPEEGNSGGDL